MPGACRLASWLCAFMVLAAGVLGCGPSAKAPPAPAGEKPKSESDLAFTTLSAQAYKSLEIETHEVTVAPVQDHLHLPGWIQARQGHEVTVTSPLAGYVQESNAPATVPTPGMPVKKDQELLALEPVLSPVEQIQLATLKRGVEGELAKAKESVAVAQAELKRVEDLQRQGLRSQQDLEQARVRLAHAQEDLRSSEDKLKLFPVVRNGRVENRLRPMLVRSPRAGSILALHVSPGQYVAAAAPLVTVIDLSEPWVRVPVPESDLPRIDRFQKATVVLDAASAGGVASRGKGSVQRVQAPPVARGPHVDPLRHTGDLFLDLSAGAGLPPVAKDQMVSVLLPLGTRQEQTLVPYAAVIYDAYGGSWIYVERGVNAAGEHRFERRRVELGAPAGDDVAVRPGLSRGTRVVTAGAAALFSREFHRPPVPEPGD